MYTDQRDVGNVDVGNADVAHENSKISRYQFR